MDNISERNILLREQIELPEGLHLSTQVLREGWNFARLVSARRLERKLHICGWNFIGLSECRLRSGVGDTSQEAISSALKMALRQIGGTFNAAGIEHIELTHYPLFYLARVSISPYRIQHRDSLPVTDQTEIMPTIGRHGRLPSNSAALFPHFGSSMFMLKELRTTSKRVQAGAQKRSFN